jgi:spermidine/putrescine transport system substrate-binding protein
MCIADWLVLQMASADYVVPLHWDALPTAQANMLDAFRDPAYDERNAHSVPWQGGVTGIAYYPDLVGGEITGMTDLWNPARGRVGMLTEMVDTMTLTLLMLGIDPQTATLDDATLAQEKLIEQRDAGIVRQYYGQDYVDDLVQRNVYVMAWSGDVFYWKYIGGAPDLEVRRARGGGVIWASADAITAGAEHPADARVHGLLLPPRDRGAGDRLGLYATPVQGVQD